MAQAYWTGCPSFGENRGRWFPRWGLVAVQRRSGGFREETVYNYVDSEVERPDRWLLELV